MQINWKIRFKNPVFIFQLVLAVLTPILAYAGLTAQDITTWSKLGELIATAIQNPYVLTLVVINAYNAITDPTTKGISDSDLAMTYEEPKED